LHDAKGCDVQDPEQARVPAIDAARSLMSGIEVADARGNPPACVSFRNAIRVEGL